MGQTIRVRLEPRTRKRSSCMSKGDRIAAIRRSRLSPSGRAEGRWPELTTSWCGRSPPRRRPCAGLVRFAARFLNMRCALRYDATAQSAGPPHPSLGAGFGAMRRAAGGGKLGSAKCARDRERQADLQMRLSPWAAQPLRAKSGMNRGKNRSCPTNWTTPAVNYVTARRREPRPHCVMPLERRQIYRTLT